MDYTKSFRTECRRSALDLQERIMADLMSVGYRDQDAYVAAFGFNPQYSDEYNKEQIRKITERPEFVRYLDRARKRIAGKHEEENPEEEFDPSLVSKERILQDLLLARKKVARGSREWIDMTKQIADITQAKKDEIKEEDTTILYYLPLTCNNCELYIAANKKRGHTP